MAKRTTELNEALARVTEEANGIFAQLINEVETRCQRGEKEIDVLEVSREAGLEIDESVLRELQVDRTILVHPFIPVYVWWPWRPIWCWWWKRYHPWYRCCPYWWHQCHYRCYW